MAVHVTGAAVCDLGAQPATSIFISIFYHSAVMITAGLVKSETLSLVLLPVGLICAAATSLDNGRPVAFGSSSSSVCSSSHHIQNTSLFPVY